MFAKLRLARSSSLGSVDLSHSSQATDEGIDIGSPSAGSSHCHVNPVLQRLRAARQSSSNTVTDTSRTFDSDSLATGETGEDLIFSTTTDSKEMQSDIQFQLERDPFSDLYMLEGPAVAHRSRKCPGRQYNMKRRRTRSPPLRRPQTWLKMMDADRINQVLKEPCGCQQKFGGYEHCNLAFSVREIRDYRLKRANMGEAERQETLLRELVALGAAVLKQTRYSINGKRCCREFFGRVGEQTSLLKTCLPKARCNVVTVTRVHAHSPKLKTTWTYSVLFLRFSQICDKTQISHKRAGKRGVRGRNWHLPQYMRIDGEIMQYIKEQWTIFCVKELHGQTQGHMIAIYKFNFIHKIIQVVRI